MPRTAYRSPFVVLSAACLLLPVLVAGPALSAGLTYRISPTAGPPGTTITFHGSGCGRTGNGPNGTDGAFAFVVRPLGNFSGQPQTLFRSSGGRFTGRYHVRAGQRPGRYPTGLSCYGDGGAGWPEPTGPHFRVSPVGIDAVVYDPPGPDTGSRSSLRAERVVLTNMTTAATDLTGWTLRDGSGAVYTFPATSLAAGASVTVHTGPGTDTVTDHFWGRSTHVWDNTGDVATLRDAAGAPLDRCRWGNGDGRTSC